MTAITTDSKWWKEFLSEDVNESTFTKEQNDLFATYQLTLDQQRIFHSIKTGRNLFLDENISDEEMVWNIGVMGVSTDPSKKNNNDMKGYRRRVVERLQKYDEAERRYKWHSGPWTRKAMKVLVEQWTLGQMVVVPGVVACDGTGTWLVSRLCIGNRRRPKRQ